MQHTRGMHVHYLFFMLLPEKGSPTHNKCIFIVNRKSHEHMKITLLTCACAVPKMPLACKPCLVCLFTFTSSSQDKTHAYRIEWTAICTGQRLLTARISGLRCCNGHKDDDQPFSPTTTPQITKNTIIGRLLLEEMNCKTIHWISSRNEQRHTS